MFDFSLGEMLVIIIIAILFLGPDKLPSVMVDVAKFFKQIKKTIGTIQDSLEQEINATGIKEEALAYKKELLKAGDDIKKTTNMANIGNHLTSLSDEIIGDVEKTKAPEPTPVAEKITFEKKPKQENTDV
ncbi:MAG: Sec-independent protein translocase protein TatB [Sulfurimonas sp.]|jgi:sec-independent protein translocase protein TatB